MPLYVIVNSHEFEVGMDLAHIVRNDDSNLGMTGGTTTEQVTYIEMVLDSVNDRIDDLVNNIPFVDVVVTGVNDTYVITGTGDPSVDGHPMSDCMGYTYTSPAFVNSAGTGVLPGSTISVIYDVTGGGTAGYCVYDTNGNSINQKSELILFHELSHAFHLANNDLDISSSASPETQAINDENLLRNAKGMTLRDPANINGSIGPCFTVENGVKHCFIVTAAYGSPFAPEVEAFRQLRDTLVRRSIWGDGFFVHLFREYDHFSPRIAMDMNRSQPLRTVIVALVVEPLTSFLKLLEVYLRGAWRDQSFVTEVTNSLSLSLRRLSEAGSNSWDASRISAEFSQLLTNLDHRQPGKKTVAQPGIVVPKDPRAALEYLESAVKVSRSSKYVSWGLVTPLVLYWEALAQFSSKEDQTAANELLRRIETWLAAAPIASDLAYATSTVASEDLELLKETVFSIPTVRHQFGARLLSALKDSVSYDLNRVLQTNDYLAVSIEREEVE